MRNYSMNDYQQPTSLGIEERWERVLCYLLGWVSGVFFLLFEHRNETVRRHAKQSTILFGGLSIIAWLAGALGSLFGHIPLIGWLFASGFGLISGFLGVVMVVLAIILMVLAYGSSRTFFVGPRHERII